MLKMRSSVMFMGAILARMGEVTISTPGGCELGSRPIDIHLKSLEELGAQVSREGGQVCCRSAKLTGGHINLDFPSVGATENLMLAACAAEGTTVITNAAREPEIVDLQLYLRSIGANLSGAGTACITVEGFKAKSGDAYAVMPDRIAAATYLCAAAAVGGDVSVVNIFPEHISTVTSSLRDMGCGIIINQNSVRIRSRGVLKAPRPIITRPYPGFPTDAQALLMAACLRADGTSVFVENIFENRYRHVDEMRRLGADIRTEGRVAMVTGVESLTGAPVTATDLRGGAALVIAALSAAGESLVYDCGHIQRGYDGLDRVLRSMGADVTVE
jgi:UDP-N-acetylglucosamine 1-carboxyvinyltransferase